MTVRVGAMSRQYKGSGKAVSRQGLKVPRVEIMLMLQTKIRNDFTIMDETPTRTFSWLKALNSAFT